MIKKILKEITAKNASPRAIIKKGPAVAELIAKSRVERKANNLFLKIINIKGKNDRVAAVFNKILVI